MTEDLARIVKALQGRGKQRGFLMIGEIQQELEEAKAPAESFEVVFAELLQSGLDLRDELLAVGAPFAGASDAGRALLLRDDGAGYARGRKPPRSRR